VGKVSSADLEEPERIAEVLKKAIIDLGPQTPLLALATQLISSGTRAAYLCGVTEDELMRMIRLALHMAKLDFPPLTKSFGN
jgi:hypothetical protein